MPPEERTYLPRPPRLLYNWISLIGRGVRGRQHFRLPAAVRHRAVRARQQSLHGDSALCGGARLLFRRICS